MYHIDYRLYERNLSMIKFLTGVPTVIINKHGSPNILHSVPIPDNYNVTRYPYRISSVTWDISVGGLNCRSTSLRISDAGNRVGRGIICHVKTISV